MHLVGCENPKYVFNRFTNEFVRVACGTCASCMVQKSYTWVTRCEMENFVHKYCFFITLTYSDENLPSLFMGDNANSLVFNRDSSICIPFTEIEHLILKNYFKDEDIKREIDYVRSRIVHPLGIPVLWKKDVSNFLKRLNKYFFDNVTKKFENFRYFCCGEYGSTTYRPHYHMLLWFDDDRILKGFSEIVRSCWSFGRTDASSIYSTGGINYVSQYVNMSAHLPAVYKIRRFAPSHQESKFPSIGCDVILDSEIRNLYDRLPIERIIQHPISGKYVSVPLVSSIKNRFFPKLQGNNYFTYYDRVVLYGAFQRLCKRTFQFDEFKDSLFALVGIENRISLSNDERILVNYFFYLRQNNVIDIKKGIGVELDSFINVLRRWFYVSKRIVYFSLLLGFSVASIVSKIDEFWKKCDYANLKKFYEFQEEYSLNYDTPKYLVILYPEFYRNLGIYVKSKNNPFYVDVALAQFDIYDEVDIPDFKDSFDYRAMSQKSFSIYKDTHKRHFINAYRDSLLDSSLKELLSNYQLS